MTLTAFVGTPIALAANDHASSHGADKSAAQSTDMGSSHSTAPSSSQSTDASSSSDHSQGNAGTSGDYDQPQRPSTADENSGGANGQCPDGPYCSTRDGSASANGNGNGAAVGEPCAGCVGKADNKNPQGQYPDGSDNNAGYECDSNHGIGQSNPAHTGCTSGTTTDCTTNPTADGCTNGGTDCTTNPTGDGCTNGGADCTTVPDSPGCVDTGTDCTTATVSGEDCTSVLGEKQTRTPAGTTPATTNVLGENVTRTPSGALPFTGANIALMTALALMTMLVGAGVTIAARKRRGFTS